MDLPVENSAEPEGVRNARNLLQGMLAAVEGDGRITLNGAEYQILSLQRAPYPTPPGSAEVRIDAGHEWEQAHLLPHAVPRKTGMDSITINIDNHTTIFSVRRLGSRKEGTRAIP